MNWRVGLTASVVLVLTAGCAGGGKAIAPQEVDMTTGAHGRATRDRDGDGDSSRGARRDADDAEVLSFGTAASASVVHELSTLMEGYDAALTAGGGGAVACSSAYSLIDQAAVEEYEQIHRTEHAVPCAVAMGALLAGDHVRLLRGLSGVVLLGARVSHHRGFALFGHGREPERYLRLHRESGRWKLQALTASTLP